MSNDDPGDLFVVLLSIFCIWAAGYIVVQVVIHFWPFLLIVAGLILVLWVASAFWSHSETIREREEEQEREWDNHIAFETEKLERTERALEALYQETIDELKRIERNL